MDSTDFFLLLFGIAGRSANLPCITNSKILRELTVCDKLLFCAIQLNRVPPHAVTAPPPRGNRVRLPRPRTTPTHNWKTLAFAAEKRLTIRTCTCRGRAPEAVPDERT